MSLGGWTIAFVAAAALCGCAESAAPRYSSLWDAAADGSDDDTPTGTTTMFGACGADRDCLKKLGAVCLTTYPGGLCTFRCDTDTDCRDESTLLSGRCFANVCLPRCGSDRCAKYGAACFAAAGYCVPACYSADRVPPSAHSCVSGTTCDEYANACFAEPSAVGADNGAPCRIDEDCRSERCLRSSEGYPDGYCASYGLLPPASAFVKGQPLPRSTCPAGSVVLPMHLGEQRAGDLTTCMRGCTSNAECRTAYTCRSLAGLGYTSGYCAPLDCATEGACPSGYRCDVDSEGRGTCVR